MDGPILVGDVGGTHARFAVADLSDSGAPISGRQDLSDAEFTSFGDALSKYLDRAKLGRKPVAVAIAVAGPIVDRAVTMTNRGWKLSEDDLKKAGFEHALLINDFAALAFSAPRLAAADFHTVGPDLSGTADGPITILGAGTGFGVSCLARYRGRAVPLATEGGHIAFAPADDEEIAVLKALEQKFGRVSAERILSGPGLENLYGALAQIGGKGAEDLKAADIQKQAEAGDDLARKALEMFCAIFGSVAGDFALAHGATGGVFIAGGIGPKIESFLQRGSFRARFEDKGRLGYFVKTIPTRLIVTADATFLGAAYAAREFVT
ncbi:MAG TPA: glucokinase [Rhizomicrobium sp.]|jgi:glucokinase